MWVTENEIPEGSLDVKSATFPKHEQPYPILFFLEYCSYLVWTVTVFVA